MIKFGIGQAVRRVEDRRFLTGQGRYVDDIVLPGMCHEAAAFNQPYGAILRLRQRCRPGQNRQHRRRNDDRCK